MSYRHSVNLIAAAVLAGCTAHSPLQNLPPAVGTNQTVQAVMNPTDEVVEEHFGIRVADPYRWLETPGPREADWVEAQRRAATTTLRGLPGYAALRSRIAELTDEVQQVESLVRANARTFFLRRGNGRLSRSLYVVDPGQPEREVVSMETEPKEAASSIDFFVPSFDGKHLAVGVSTHASEQATVRVYDAQTGAEAPRERIADVLFDIVAWLPGGDAFLYSRKEPLAQGAPATDTWRNVRVFLHRRGTAQAEDVAVWSVDLAPKGEVREHDLPALYTGENGRRVLVILERGAGGESRAVYAKSTSAITDATVPWERIASFDDKVYEAVVHGDDILLRRNFGESNGEIVRTRGPLTATATTEVLLPESSRVLREIAAGADALYVTDATNGVASLQRIPWGAHHAELVQLPFAGSLTGLMATPRGGVSFQLEGWTQPATWYHVNAKSAVSPMFGGTAPALPGIVVERVQVPASDGEKIPLTLVYREGHGAGSRSPVWLTAYGAYGVSLDPAFRPTRLAFLERGGIYAFAHARGGGEKGPRWHAAGKLATKQRTVDDVIDCAEYLLKRKYATADQLALLSGSAGGILAGGVMITRPDLFRAIIVRVGAMNVLRLMEVSTVGPANIAEFGDPSTPEGFALLVKQDAYLNLRDGTAYPAVLFMPGRNDPKVPYWQSAKFVARLAVASSSKRPILLRLDDTGHSIGATSEQQIDTDTDMLSFVLWQLGDPQVRQAIP